MPLSFPNSVKSNKIIVILGPTASGKSELAVEIAKKFKGEIISADSRQVYKGLNIGSGKVPKDKSKIKDKNYFYKGIKHYLIDVASPKRTFTVAQYQKLAQKAIKEIIKKNKVPIICGGTGFYIDSLIYNYQFPSPPPQPKLRKKLEKETTEKLFEKLRKLDPRRAKNIDKNNRRRLIRALEIILTTGQPVQPLIKTEILSSIDKSNINKNNFEILKIGIKKSPAELKKLIKKRLLKRLKQGMIKEVANLHFKQSLSWKRLNDLGLEYCYVSRYLRGLITKKEMIEALLKQIWHYARRQMTWFKRDPEIIWINKRREAVKIISLFLNKK